MLIKSQQYINDMYIIVKELIENSLDADSSKITVIITDSSIIIEDNGCGLNDLEAVCKPGYTSKENTSYYILGIAQAKSKFTHGFRGQALASISQMCEVEITSKSEESNRPAQYKNYTSEIKGNRAREKGTTVKITNIFKNCPIRQKANQKTIRKSLAKILNLLKSYIYVYNVTFKLIYKNNTLFNETGSENTKEIATALHGSNIVEILAEGFEFFLFPFSMSETQQIFVEKRVCKFERIVNTVKSIFKLHFKYAPTFILFLKEECDINLSVDKTDIIIKNSAYVENKIKAEVNRYFALNHYVEESKCNEIIENKLDSSLLMNSWISDEKMIKNDTLSREQVKLENCCLAHEEICEKSLEIGCNNFIATPSSTNKEISLSSNVFEDSISENSIKRVKNEPESYKQLSKNSAYHFMKKESLEHAKIIFNKEDFREMQVIGQFNQGFIVCSLKKEGKVFLIAVDQHAADEISNYERLKRTFKLKKQQLLGPIDLNLTAKQQLLVEDNEEVFEANGFQVSNGKLLAIPVYQGVFFSVDDFHILLDGIANGVLVSEKYKHITSSKACRSSIMIGHSLGLKEMKKILENLSLLEIPWSCPHGRPTFKILSELPC
ncbi:ATP-binding mismatch repair protein [Glugoides intestinalis]